MKYLKFTYVDAITGTPITEATASNGPKFPDVEGLEFSFALESQYTTNTPTFFGTCPDEAITMVPGVIDVLTEVDFLQAQTDEIANRAAVAMVRAKIARQVEVDAITVTTQSGKVFDGDEVSQGRMARTIIALNPGETTLWILADNTPDPNVTREELQEALRLAGEAQTAIWVRPYL